MGKKLSEVEKEAMELLASDRARLAVHLLETMDGGEDVDAEAQWIEEAEKRYRDYRAGKIGATPANKIWTKSKL
jgi:hypothetical protein